MYKPYHLIGMELGISIYSAVLRSEPTGAPTAFRGDVVAVAKRDLPAGETLDGEGGYTVWGKLVPARRSLDLCGAADRARQGRAADARRRGRRDRAHRRGASLARRAGAPMRRETLRAAPTRDGLAATRRP